MENTYKKAVIHMDEGSVFNLDEATTKNFIDLIGPDGTFKGAATLNISGEKCYLLFTNHISHVTLIK